MKGEFNLVGNSFPFTNKEFVEKQYEDMARSYFQEIQKNEYKINFLEIQIQMF